MTAGKTGIERGTAGSRRTEHASRRCVPQWLHDTVCWLCAGCEATVRSPDPCRHVSGYTTPHCSCEAFGYVHAAPQCGSCSTRRVYRSTDAHPITLRLLPRLLLPPPSSLPPPPTPSPPSRPPPPPLHRGWPSWRGTCTGRGSGSGPTTTWGQRRATGTPASVPKSCNLAHTFSGGGQPQTSWMSHTWGPHEPNPMKEGSVGARNAYC